MTPPRPFAGLDLLVCLGLIVTAMAPAPGAELTASLGAEMAKEAAGLPLPAFADFEPDLFGIGFGQYAEQSPIDQAYRFGTSPMYCPSFLPELYPGLNLGQMCEDEFYSSPRLLQRNAYNPFDLAREEFEKLARDEVKRNQRLALAAAYAYLHRDCDEWATDTLLAMLARSRFIRDEVVVDALADLALPMLPQNLVTATPPEGQIAVDLRALSNVSYDSVASIERTIKVAAKRGIKAMAIADRSSIHGWQKAQRVAARLKQERQIPEDFLIITGQVIYTHLGPVLALFTTDFVPDNMTMERTLALIRDEDGLAFLLHPGVAGGPERLLKFDFDGYVLQPRMFEMFRVLSLINDPRYAGRVAITASNAEFSGTAGLPYTLIETDEVSPEGIKRAIRGGKAYAAGDLYLPWMTLASYPPVSKVSRVLNSYFTVHQCAETWVARAIGADSLSLSTSWDNEIRTMMGIAGMPGGISDIIEGASPLTRLPRIRVIAAEYSVFRIGYDTGRDEGFVTATLAW